MIQSTIEINEHETWRIEICVSSMSDIILDGQYTLFVALSKRGLTTDYIPLWFSDGELRQHRHAYDDMSRVPPVVIERVIQYCRCATSLKAFE